MRAINTRVKRISGCEGKERFVSFNLARKIASKSAHRKGEARQAYACHFCGGFHVGSPNGSDRGIARDSRQPYRVFAQNGDGVECFIGRAPTKDGGKLKEILAKDGWIVTKVIGEKSRL
jgi:hypothetical protein